MLSALSIPDFFDVLAVRLNGQKADGKKLTIHFDFTDIDEQYVLYLENAVINYRISKQIAKPDVSLQVSKKILLELFSKRTRFPKLLLTGEVKISGNLLKLKEFFNLFDSLDHKFPIVLP